MKNKFLIIGGIVIILVIAMFSVWFFAFNNEEPVQVREVEGSEYERLGPITLFGFQKDVPVSSPLILTGSAPSSWFFEGDFPVVLTDWDGLIIAEGYAKATEEVLAGYDAWFNVFLKFEKPEYKNNGTLIFQKDNPSGLAENDAFAETSILFQ